MRILVTGGAGFIGRSVVRVLAGRGEEVVVLDSLRPDVHRVEPPEPPAGASLVVADVRDRDAVAQAAAGTAAVVHLAAKVGLGVGFGDVEDYVASNDAGTAALLAALAAAGGRRRTPARVVYASSMVVYGEGAYRCARHGRVVPQPRREADLRAGRFEPRCPGCGEALTPGLVTEDAPVDPRNVYAATKVHGEHLMACWARETGGSVASLRFHNVYGPGLPRDTPYAGVAAIFCSQLRGGHPPKVFEDGNQRRDFVHVADVAEAVAAAVDAAVDAELPAAAARAYNIGSGTVTTVGQMAAALAAAAGAPAPVVTGRYRLGDVRHVTASSERATRELGWRARVPLAQGVRDLLARAVT